MQRTSDPRDRFVDIKERWDHKGLNGLVMPDIQWLIDLAERMLLVDEDT